MTKEELIKIRKIMDEVQQKRSVENMILAYQTTIDLELQQGKETFLQTLFQRAIADEDVSALMKKMDKDNYNFRNRMLHKCWQVMLNKQKISESESKMLLLEPTICPYDDIFSFEFSPVLGGNSIVGYVRKQRLLKSLENLGYTPNDFTNENSLFQLNISQNTVSIRNLKRNQETQK